MLVPDVAGNQPTTVFSGPTGNSPAAGYANGTAANSTFRNPAGILFEPNGNLLIVADKGNNVIRSVKLADGSTDTLAGALPTDGTAAAAAGETVLLSTLRGRSTLDG